MTIKGELGTKGDPLTDERRNFHQRDDSNAYARAGRVPGDRVNGEEAVTLTVSVDAKRLQALILHNGEAGRNALITLKVGGDQPSGAAEREIQRNAITRVISHVDLHRVSLKQKIEAARADPRQRRSAPGVKLGGGVFWNYE